MLTTRYLILLLHLSCFFSFKTWANFSCKKTFENYKHVKLIEASKKGDIDQVIKLLDQKAEINFLFSKDRTPLMYAAMNGYTELVEKLISAGAKIDLTDKYGKTALIFAIENKHIETALSLIKNQASFKTAIEYQGVSPLVSAVHSQKEEMVQILVDNGVNNYSENNNGENELTLAVMGGNEKIVNILLNSIHNPMSLNKYLMLALKMEHTNIMKILIDKGGIDINRPVKYGGVQTTFLIEALLSGNTQNLLLLLNKNADINGKNLKGETALMIAFKTGNTKNAMILIDRGADILGIDNKGEDIIDIIIKNGLSSALEALIDRGINIIEFHINKEPRLITAAKYSNKEIMQKLLDFGVDIDETFEGETAVMFALKTGNIENLLFLIDRGADIKLENNKAEDLIDIVIKQDSIEALEILAHKGIDVTQVPANKEPRLMISVESKQGKSLQKLLEFGVDIDETFEGETALMKAVRYNRPGLVKLLLENGAEAKILNNEGQTAWDLAKSYQYKKVLELLPENLLSKDIVTLDKENMVVQGGYRYERSEREESSSLNGALFGEKKATDPLESIKKDFSNKIKNIKEKGFLKGAFSKK